MEIYSYLSLALGAFLAATILPFSSEAILTVMTLAGEYNPLLLLFFATLGNVLGSITNWFLGRYVLLLQKYRWFPFKEKEIEKAKKIYTRYGFWSLFLSWVPFIGDPLTLVAGFFRFPLFLFIGIVFLAKMGRYYILLCLLTRTLLF